MIEHTKHRPMFAKIFVQIFESSIAENYNARHVFMDLLVLADSDGVVDMTPESIARRTNAPLVTIKEAIKVLSNPDPKSRSKDEDGRRIVSLDPKRDWGWQIVNYAHYRAVRDEEKRREYFREYRRKERESKRTGKPKKKLEPVGFQRNARKPGPDE